MAWLDLHEPWVDRRLKIVSTTRTDPSGDLESYGPKSARNQKRYWREPLAENFSVLDIGISKWVDSNDGNEYGEKFVM